MSVKPFSTFLMEDVRKDITFTFGRFNPPTLGHEKLMQAVKDNAKGGQFRIYVSPSHDPKKNPLSPKEKIGYMREMFPKFARQIMTDHDAANILQVCTKLYDQGYSQVTLVVGEDRVDEFNTLLNKYNGKKMEGNGFYNFNSIKVVSAGERDPDSTGLAGVSASGARESAARNDGRSFQFHMPRYTRINDLFSSIRRGMGLEESTNSHHVQLEPVSEIREAYVQGGLFQIDEQVTYTKTGEAAQIKLLGSNYLVVEMNDSGARKRVWLTDVERFQATAPKTTLTGSGRPLSKLRS